MSVNGKNKFFYINGDSWLINNVSDIINQPLSQVYNTKHSLDTNIKFDLFKDKFVINHSISGGGNLSIIERTIMDLKELDKFGIRPQVCIGLSEVGRDLIREFSLVRPQADMSAYLESILQHEIKLLQEALKGYSYYICTAWTSSTIDTRSIIDFIDFDHRSIAPAYAIGNGIYQWLTDRVDIFKFNKELMIDCIQQKQVFEQRLLDNPYIDNTLHIKKERCQEVYSKFFQHVLQEIDK